MVYEVLLLTFLWERTAINSESFIYLPNVINTSATWPIKVQFELQQVSLIGKIDQDVDYFLANVNKKIILTQI